MQSQRIHFLDGVRGWAAFSVLLFHVFWEFFGARFPEFRSGIFKFAFNGPMAVYVFFVLSGDALSTPFLATRDVGIIRSLAFKRYPRLSVPILLTCLLTAVVVKLGLSWHQAAAEVVNRSDWLGSFLQFKVSAWGAFKFALLGVYQDTTPSLSYNPFLWTMPIELAGSLLLFLFLLQIEHLRWPVATALLLAVGLFIAKSYSSLFFIGSAIAILRAQGAFKEGRTWPLMGLSWVCITGVIVSCWHSTDIVNDSFAANSARASLLIVAVNCNRHLMAFLSTGLSRFLGRISFPLYLTHFVVLISLTSYLTLHWGMGDALVLSTVIGIGLVSVVAALGLATLFERVQDRALQLTFRTMGLATR